MHFPGVAYKFAVDANPQSTKIILPHPDQNWINFEQSHNEKCNGKLQSNTNTTNVTKTKLARHGFQLNKPRIINLENTVLIHHFFGTGFKE